MGSGGCSVTFVGAMVGAINRRNALGLPFVDSASTAAEASGVCNEGIAAVATTPTSRTRCFSRRSSLLLCSEYAPNDKPAVMSTPTAATTAMLNCGA